MAIQGAASATPQPASSRALDTRRQLQHFLVMKAFNLRKGTLLTLAQQFQGLRQLDATTGRGVVALGPLCASLAIPPFRRLVLCQVFGLPADAPPSAQIDFDAFLRFLQTAAVEAAHEERELRRQHSGGALPVPPTDQREPPGALVCFAPSLLSMRFARPPPAPGLWKKREVTIQERITEYTKIDELGRAQHLVERERHQSEVLHMESLAGEFAHREVTHYEQLEQLNDEVVHHERGREEFVHLKSQHDEVSKFESSIPTARPEECEQPPPSPTIKRDPSAMDEPRAFGGAGSPLARMPEDEDADGDPRHQCHDADAEMEAMVDGGYPMEPFPEAT